MAEKLLHKSKKKKPVWEKPRPKIGKPQKLTPAQKAKAKARTAKAGRRYPNLVDNMAVAKKSKSKTAKR